MGPQQLGQRKAGLEIAPVGGNAALQRFRLGLRVGHLHLRVAGLHPALQGIQASHTGSLGDDGSKRHLGIVVLTQLQQQLDQIEAGVVVGRVGGDGLLEFFESTVHIALGQGVLGVGFLGFGLDLALGGHMLVQEGADLAFGQGAHEAVHRLTVLEQHAGRDAADAEGAGELLLLVGIDLHQLEASGIGGFQFLQQRADHLARTAPRGPEIHQHRGVHGGFDDLGFKVGDGDVDHGYGRPEAG